MPGSDAVVAEGLAKRYPGGVWGAIDVSFSSPWHRVTVLLGPNGAGKTTTIGILSTILKPSRGRGLVAGFDVVREAREVRRRIALVPQETRIDLNWTPLEAVKWYLVARGWSIRDAERRAREVLEQLGLWEIRNRSGWGLSGGQKRKTVTAMALATEAEVVFLDEPTTGLDVESRYGVWDAVRGAAAEDRCIVFTTHDMREAEMLADHAVFISKGRVVAEGSPGRLREALPYRHRVVLRRPRRSPEGLTAKTIRVGDTVIAYASSRGEAHAIAEEAEAESATVEPVGFEDVYLYYVHEARVGNNA